MWTSFAAIDPSPTADATRLMEPCRTSPAASTPGIVVSSEGTTVERPVVVLRHVLAGDHEAMVISQDLRRQPLRVWSGPDEYEQRVGVDGLFFAGRVAQHELLEVTLTAAADDCVPARTWTFGVASTAW